jgi:hypothetical protein
MARKALVVVVVVLALAGCSVSPSPAGDEADLTGTYTCDGDNGSGPRYKGTVDITKEGDAYNLTWTIGRETHRGVALREGNTLSSCWVTEGVGGVVVYRIQKGPKLVGRWTQFGAGGKVLDEVLTKQ